MQKKIIKLSYTITFLVLCSFSNLNANELGFKYPYIDEGYSSDYWGDCDSAIEDATKNALTTCWKNNEYSDCKFEKVLKSYKYFNQITESIMGCYASVIILGKNPNPNPK